MLYKPPVHPPSSAGLNLMMIRTGGLPACSVPCQSPARACAQIDEASSNSPTTARHGAFNFPRNASSVDSRVAVNMTGVLSWRMNVVYRRVQKDTAGDVIEAAAAASTPD